MTSTIKVNNIQNQCGANIINENSDTITIGASGDTIALASGASQTGFGRTGTVDWQTTPKTTTFTAADGEGYFIVNSFGNTILQMGIDTTITITNIGGETPYKVQFQGSHLIWEHEYQCTIDEHEFNDTLNISARKIKSADSYELADFATSSLFKPYVTTIGLYNEENELLVVGKLGQPVRASNETDTTFIIRWDS